MDDEKSGAYVRPPSGSFTSWENTMCNPLGDMRTQVQNAWHDGYASAKAEREWVGLTTAETKALWSAAEKKPSQFAAMLEAKLKEKNDG